MTLQVRRRLLLGVAAGMVLPTPLLAQGDGKRPIKVLLPSVALPQVMKRKVSLVLWLSRKARLSLFGRGSIRNNLPPISFSSGHARCKQGYESTRSAFHLQAGLKSKVLVIDDNTFAVALHRLMQHIVKTPFTSCSKNMQLSAELSTIL